MKATKIGVMCGALLVSSLIAQGAARGAQTESGVTFPDARVSHMVDAHGAVVGYVAIGPGEGDVGGVLIVDGLTPGEHGVHLHSAGVCDPTGEKPFASAGSHFNPGNMLHGAHSGDLGNLTADASGSAAFAFGSGTWTLDDGMFGLADVDGTAIVVHETTDDLITDPAGNSGGRIACAVLVPPAV